MQRGRRYEQGIRLPISLEQINAYCEIHECGLSRFEFDDAIFALDDAVLSDKLDNKTTTS